MKILSNNKKAYHNFFISDATEAGISLCGSEVKSVRKNGMGIEEGFIIIKDGEMLLKNAYIKRYEQAASYAPEERRTRKLLLHREEIARFNRKLLAKGFTMVPLKVYLKEGLVKVEVGLAQGKKLYDKRETLKEKQQKREIDREVKSGKQTGSSKNAKFV